MKKTVDTQPSFTSPQASRQNIYAGNNLSNQTLQGSAAFCNITSNQALLEVTEGNCPIQMTRERHPTFYTYMKTSSSCKLSLSCQGPHTVPHVFLSFLVDSYNWDELFREQIAPFTPEMVNGIIESEIQNESLDEAGSVEFSYRRTRFLARYQELYERLLAANSAAELSGKPAPEWGDCLMEIMSMHPYGSYCWKPAQTPTKEELKGKGESGLGRALTEAYQAGIDDGTSVVRLEKRYEQYLLDNGFQERFSNPDMVYQFIQLRIKDVLLKPNVAQLLDQIKGEPLGEGFALDSGGALRRAANTLELLCKSEKDPAVRKSLHELSQLVYGIFFNLESYNSKNVEKIRKLNNSFETALSKVHSLDSYFIGQNTPNVGIKLIIYQLEQAHKKYKTNSQSWFERLKNITEELNTLLSQSPIQSEGEIESKE